VFSRRRWSGCSISSEYPGRAGCEQSVMNKINLLEKLSQFTDHYHPRIVGDLNEHEVKVVKLQGEFVWRHHEDTDELFLVVRGRMRMGLRTGDVELSEG